MVPDMWALWPLWSLFALRIVDHFFWERLLEGYAHAPREPPWVRKAGLPPGGKSLH